MGFAERLDRFFGITERGSTIGTELKGGFLAFLALSYILVVNPSMMADAGMDRDAAFTATILVSAIGCILVALYARFPAAQAPAMGVNAFFTYTVVITLGYTWQEALAAVTISGFIYLAISLSGLRQRILNAIPEGLRCGIGAGIGCFVAFIGLNNSGLIAGNPDTLVTLGDLSSPLVLLALFCLLFTFVLRARHVKGDIMIGMAVTAVIGIVVGLITIPESIFSTPAAPEFGTFLDGLTSDVFTVEFIAIIASFVMVDFFDSAGTLLAVGSKAGLMDKDGNITCGEAMTADATSAALSGVIGCTPTTTYAETTVAIDAGSKTGLTTLVVGLLFLLALGIGPLMGMVTYQCTVGAMVIVGVSMMTSLKDVDWDDMPSVVAVVSTILFMMLTYSITNGIAFGIILYSITMIAQGRTNEVSRYIHFTALVCLLYLVLTAIAI